MRILVRYLLSVVGVAALAALGAPGPMGQGPVPPSLVVAPLDFPWDRVVPLDVPIGGGAPAQ
jgi:hypothetical protein